MAPVAIMTSLSLMPTLLAASAADGLFTATPGCHSLLQDIAAQGRSDVELAAYCRARMPPQLCRDAAGSLGSQPWSADRIASTCQKWEEQWNARAAMEAPGLATMDFAEMQAKTDQCVKLKAQAGLCKDSRTGGPLQVDRCAMWKAKVYPEQTNKWHDTLWGFYANRGHLTLRGQGVHRSFDVYVPGPHERAPALGHDYGIGAGKGQQKPAQAAPQPRAPKQPTLAPGHGVKDAVSGAIGSAITKGKQHQSEQAAPQVHTPKQPTQAPAHGVKDTILGAIGSAIAKGKQQMPEQAAPQAQTPKQPTQAPAHGVKGTILGAIGSAITKGKQQMSEQAASQAHSPEQPTQAPAHGVKDTVLGAIGSAIAKGKQQSSEQAGPQGQTPEQPTQAPAHGVKDTILGAIGSAIAKGKQQMSEQAASQEHTPEQPTQAPTHGVKDAILGAIGGAFGKAQQQISEQAALQAQTPEQLTQVPAAHGVKDALLGAIGSAIAKGKQQKSEQVGPIATSGMVGSGFFAGTAVLAAVFVAVAGAMTFGRFWRRVGAPEHSHVLVSDSPENSALGDA